MDELYLGTIFAFAGNFIPENCMPCYGQSLPIASNTALFSLLGTMYGGDGHISFCLPDLRGRAAIGIGTGPGLTTYGQGNMSGREFYQLTEQNLPAHNHNAAFTPGNLSVQATVNAGNAGTPTNNPEGNYWGTVPNAGLNIVNMYTDTKNIQMANDAVEITATGNIGGTVTVGNNGNSGLIDGRSPFLAVNYLIVVSGLYPSRS